eukprot:TRINITY_DN1488_c0_g1_i4.p1 TRINITY_DN1488_c0_g1~~TRINITY_DN1488_c0_g1_i4.p1  ORF type:complete len:163 (+),score=43.42 TRINITY_DN1488_c0_g1_i4:96-584(+)
MSSVKALLLLAPAIVLGQNGTIFMPNYNTTSMPSNYTTTNLPSNYTTTSLPSNYTTTAMPSNYTTSAMPNETTTTALEFCSGHVCLPEENGFFSEGCCENSYCQCYGGMGYLKHCDGEECSMRSCRPVTGTGTCPAATPACHPANTRGEVPGYSVPGRWILS